MIETDICVIGAGAGGLSVAAGAVQMGARVVLVEGGAMGGDCLNAGCVPSKALLAAAHAARPPQGLGITYAPQVDFPAVMDHVARAIATIAPHDSQDRFQALGCTVIRDWGRFADRRTLMAGGQAIRARRFVIATGSSPVIPDIQGLAGLPYFTNESIFGLRALPDHLLILGAGPIGVEMATAFASLGAQVSLVDPIGVLPREDAEASALITAALRDLGVRLYLGQAVTAFAHDGDGISAQLAQGESVAASHLLLATGRRSALAGLDLPAAGVAMDGPALALTRGLRSVSNRRIYAIGDAAGQGQFTHLAGYHAGLIIRQCVLGLPARVRSDHIPRVTYTSPELAQIGLTEAEATRQFGPRAHIARAEFATNDRAVTAGGAAGFAKLIIHKNRLIGATVIGPHAGEVIAPLSLAMSQRLPLSALAGMVLPYPTVAEICKRAASAYFSPKLFDNPALKRVVGLLQRLIP